MNSTQGGSRQFNYLGWLAAIVVAITFIFLNLDGYHNELGSYDLNAEPPNINWTHGWPYCFLGRPSVYSLSSGIDAPTPTTLSGNDMGRTSRWPIDSVPISYFRPYKLAVDILVLLTLTIGTAYSLQTFTRGHPRTIRFDLKFLFATVTIVAVLAAVDLPAHISRQALTHVAEGTIALALFVTVAGALKASFCALRRIGAKGAVR